jgi:hypothetical protein
MPTLEGRSAGFLSKLSMAGLRVVVMAVFGPALSAPKRGLAVN